MVFIIGQLGRQSGRRNEFELGESVEKLEPIGHIRTPMDKMEPTGIKWKLTLSLITPTQMMLGPAEACTLHYGYSHTWPKLREADGKKSSGN